MRGAADLRAHHERVVGVHYCAFGRAPGQLVGVGDVPLVELVVSGDEDSSRPARSAAGTARLLPQRCQRAGESVEDYRIEAADVDAELECVGGGDPEEAPLREVVFERPSLAREVARAIRGDLLDQVGCAAGERTPGVLRDELGAAPAAREREGLVAVADEAAEQLRGLHVGRRACAGRLVEERPLPACEDALGARRPVGRDLVDRLSAEGGGEVAGVADRRAGEAERRSRPVVLAHPPESPEDVSRVASEDPPQRVQLVDHHIPEAHEEGRPALVRREDPDVEHLGVREHDVRIAPGPGAVVGGGVAVVGDGLQPRHQPGAHGAELVLGERLRREDE